MVAVDWGRRPVVLVIALRALRASQVAGDSAPRLYEFARRIEEALKLQSGEVVVDVLLGCGLGHEAASDHVAACGARFTDNQTKYGDPAVVLLVGTHAEVAAYGAGLAVGVHWSPIGTHSAAPIFVTREPILTRDLADDLAKSLLRRKRMPGVLTATSIRPLAEDLFAALGKMDGSAWLSKYRSSWRRSKSKPLTVDRVEAHVRRKYVVAPFRPTGPWPYVVLDIDQHDAMQAAELGHTLGATRQLFPSSMIIQSSWSGGVHAYIRLPPDTQYEEAAAWVEAYLAMNRMLFIERTARRGGQPPAIVRSRRVEVPRQPPRLPFGLSSGIVGSLDPLDRQVRDFIAFITTAPADDFENAKNSVLARHGRFGRKWSVEKKRRLRCIVETAELAELRLPELPATDAWHAILPALRKADPAAAVVGARGVPAMGTRSRWIGRLIDALFDLVEPEEVEHLMKVWLYDREHNSEDIEADVYAVELGIVRAVEAKKAALVGVPERVWQVIKEDIKNAFATAAHGQRGPLKWAAKHPAAKIDVLLGNEITLTAGALHPSVVKWREDKALVEETAFFIAMGFFERREIQRPIPGREFSRFLTKALRPTVRELLLLGGWLRAVRSAIPGVEAKVFELNHALWPALPGEPVRFVP